MLNHSQDSDDAGFFIKVKEELKKGYSFIPLVGAGFSANAGIPVIHQLSQYLQRCVALALGVEVDPDDRCIRHWRPHSDAWPPLADPYRPLEIDWYAPIEREWRRRVNENRWDPESRVFQEALGAMADWRSSLQFLSRIRTENTEPDGIERIYLDARAPEVVDRFFLHVTQSRTPSLTHRMLAHLSGVLRSKILLTTNFDELIERAFLAAGKALTAFDVQLDGGLPHRLAMQGSTSLIKLHGGRFGLRGDYSLDDLPSERDRNLFVEYLTDKTFSNTSSLQQVGSSHLLVMGLSASDRRIRHFLEHSFKHVKYQIYWVCYNERDLELSKEFAKQFEGRSEFITVRTNNLGLFLQNFYQNLARAFPPNGIIFPSIARLPYPPESRITSLASEAKTIQDKLISRIKTIQKPEYLIPRIAIMHAGKRNKSILEVSGDENIAGVTSIAAEVFKVFRDDGQNCLWIDLIDIASTDDFYEQLLDTIWFACGIEEEISIHLGKNAHLRAELIHDSIQATGRKWLLFLNNREKAGANYFNYDNSKPNGWLDEPNECASFTNLILEIGSSTCPMMSIVMLCNSHTQSYFLDHIQKETNRGFDKKRDTWIELVDSCSEQNHTEKVTKAIEWANSHSDESKFRLELLATLSYMQRTRFPASVLKIMQRLGHDDNDKVYEYLDYLLNNDLFRYKEGHFIWFFQPVRDDLRGRLKGAVDVSSLHRAIATHYEDLFTISGKTGAVHESIYHIIKSLTTLNEHIPPYETKDVSSVQVDVCDGNKGPLSAEEKESVRLLTWALNLLNKSNHAMRTKGFSKSNCRRLEQLRDSLDLFLKKAFRKEIHLLIKSLRNTCTDTMRGIAFEVGENVKCYDRTEEMHGLPKSIRTPIHNKAHLYTIKSFERRWRGTLHYSARSYSYAKEQLAHALCKIRNYSSDKFKPSKELPDLSFINHDLPSSLRINAAAILEQYSQILLLQCSVYGRSQQAHLFNRDESVTSECDLSSCHKKAVEILEIASEITQDAMRHGESTDKEMSLEKLMVRVLSHQAILSIISPNLNQNDLRKASERAEGFFHRADELMELIDPRRERSSWAKLCLHRAEYFIQMAKRTMVDNRTYDQICREISSGSAIQLDESLCRIILSYLREAGRALDEAERGILRRRKSVWWTTWLFQRRLQLIELELWLTCHAKGEPIPCFGLEFAPRHTETRADRLLKDVCRVIRLDSYRLATVVETYACCAKAFDLRLMRDPKSVRQPERQAAITSNLRFGLAQLQRAHSERVLMSTKPRKERITMKTFDKPITVDKSVDRSVIEYINHVIVTTGKLLGELEHMQH